MCNTHCNVLFHPGINHPLTEGDLSDEQLEQIVGGVPFQVPFLQVIEFNPVNGRAYVRDLTPFMCLNTYSGVQFC